ncbi:hypothetical protein SAMN05216360_11970 [Methylobacterium phyllostachyos]|uniref:Uncharacterized protein n=1 Tax=Methylobacterium phyllostachyos TaxID=582672 RepID=A0A1H0ILG7_9HYPH|nr:hypothetical protein [Methylobacterium phyllostachyos]SDO32277.1 hypothetical protein SAMN05216360_11970 [Methylobacterium phyllostachyos]
MLAEAGCTLPEIPDRYLAPTRSLADSAIAKLDDHRRNRVDLQTE